MKKHILLFLLPVFFSATTFARLPQSLAPEPSLKYGKPSDEELALTSYAPDTSASAIVLYKKCDISYEFNSDLPQIVYLYETKIKVLKPEGASYANVAFSYYFDEDNLNLKETPSQIEATSYNLENGKTVRTKMKRDLVVKERIDDNFMQIKFTVPAVKAGTVFEYRYKLTSNLFTLLHDWYAQGPIPVVFAQCDAVVPDYFRFSIDMHGIEKLEQKEKKETLTLSYMTGGGQSVKNQIGARHLTFTGRQLPGLYPDSYLWCPDEYRAQVNFELKSFIIPGSVYKDFTHTWEQVDEELLKRDAFEAPLGMHNPYRDQMASLGLDRLTTQEEKIVAIFTFLKKKIAWNNQYGLYGNETKNAVKKGTGSNAEINFVLMSMLRDAQIPAFPVVMSTRTLGNLPYSHPSIDRINTFVVAAATSDTTFAVIDGSVTHGYLDILPPVLLTNRARLLAPGAGEKWIDLSRSGKNQSRSAVNATIGADGTITGTRSTAYHGQSAARFREAFLAAKDSAGFIGKTESDLGIRITGFKTSGRDAFSPVVREELAFEKQAVVNDSLIYLNPMIFLHTAKSPFVQEKRILPVEMPYPTQYTQVVTLTLPDGYDVEELPKPMIIKIDGGRGYCQYTLTRQGNRISLRYQFGLDKLIFLPTEYADLKAFWEAIAEKNNETLVLKKI